MQGTIRYNNGVRSNSVTPAVAGVEQEPAILRCMSVGMNQNQNSLLVKRQNDNG